MGSGKSTQGKLLAEALSLRPSSSSQKLSNPARYGYSSKDIFSSQVVLHGNHAPQQPLGFIPKWEFKTNPNGRFGLVAGILMSVSRAIRRSPAGISSPGRGHPTSARRWRRA